MNDTPRGISVKAIAELLRRIDKHLALMDYQRASGVCIGAAAMLDGVVAEDLTCAPVLFLPSPPIVRDPGTGRFKRTVPLEEPSHA